MKCYFQYDYLECVNILLDVGHCDPNVQDSHGNTTLHNAFIRKYEACVNKLLDAGADSDIKNNDGIEAMQGYWLVNTGEGLKSVPLPDQK